MAYGGQGKGPLAGRRTVVATAFADEGENGRRVIDGRRNGGKEGESARSEIHGTLANITVALVILHVLGVGLASVVRRENLVLAMINGRKRTDE
jgi:cytochrome b